MTAVRVEQAMKDLVSEVTQSVVARLAERYSFDATEALKALDQEPSPKISKATANGKKGGERITPSIPLPSHVERRGTPPPGSGGRDP